MRSCRSLWPNKSGAGAAEFALVLPLFLLLLLGILDAGRFMWEYNRAEKATQMGVRYAVATALVPGQAFADYSFAVEDEVPQGSSVPTAEFDRVVCDNVDCTCTGGDVCGVVARDSTAFGNIVDRMSVMYPPINDDNVQVEYRNVGLGYSGDPNGPDVAPLVTVQLQGLSFQPITCMLFACSVGMPDFRAALTLEDGSGDVSN